MNNQQGNTQRSHKQHPMRSHTRHLQQDHVTTHTAPLISRRFDVLGIFSRRHTVWAMMVIGLALLGAARGQTPDVPKRVKTSVLLSVDQAHPGSSFQAAVIAELEKPWHINAHKPTLDFLIPTELRLEPLDGFTIGPVQYPAAKRLKFEFADEPLDVYDGQVIMRVPIKVARNVAPGEKLIKGKFQYQACNDEVCEAPVTLDIAIPVRVVSPDKPSRQINTTIFGSTGTTPPTQQTPTTTPPTAPDGQHDQSPGQTAQQPPTTPFSTADDQGDIGRLLQQKGLSLTLLFIFVLGLGLNLTPCVYPMIPITIGFFTNQSEGRTARVLALGLMYLLGIAVTYSGLGVAAALTGQMFGALLQNPWMLIVIAGVMVMLALSLFGVYQIRPPSFIMHKVSGQSGAGLLGALSMGLLVGIVAAPCVGPVTLGLLTYVSATASAWLGFIMFFTLSLGLGLPYVVLALFSGGLRKLPRSGVWMIWVERLLGCAMLGMALYFLAPLLPDQLVPWLALALAITSGIYLGWLETSRGGPIFGWMKKAVGVAAIALGIWFVVPKAPAKEAISWQPYTATLLDQLRQQGQPAILDFTADWCIPCKELDRFTFSDARVIQATKSFTMVKVDLTKTGSPEVEQLRKQFGITGVPTIVFFDEQGREVKEARVVGFIKASEFLERIKRVGPTS